MEVSIDSVQIEVPAAQTLGELLDGVAPHVHPTRLVTAIDVDGVPADGTDKLGLARWRLAGGEHVRIQTHTPTEFAAARRREIPGHLARVADLLDAVVASFASGDTAAANWGFATAMRDLRLILELDAQLAVLERTEPICAAIGDAIRRLGPACEEAVRAARWHEVASLLVEDLIPLLRSSGHELSPSTAGANG